MSEYVRYQDDIKTIEADDQDIIDRVISVFRKGAELLGANYGRSARGIHAKAHGLLRGEIHTRQDVRWHR